MKTKALHYIIFFFFLASLSLSAQDAISYQAVARNAEGKILSEQLIGVKVEILQGTAEGAAVYSETHEAKTSQTGVVNLSIGTGTEPSGSFSDIDWGASTYFLKLSMDTEGGKEYKEVATTQIMPVPYALYAKKAGNVKENNDFLIIPNDYRPHIFKMISGELDLNTGTMGADSTSIEIECTLYYLNKKNQHLNLRIDNLPEGCERHDRVSEYETQESLSIGRYLEFTYRVPVGTFDNLKFVVYNEQTNQIVEEYPFKLNVSKDE